MGKFAVFKNCGLAVQQRSDPWFRWLEYLSETYWRTFEAIHISFDSPSNPRTSEVGIISAHFRKIPLLTKVSPMHPDMIHWYFLINIPKTEYLSFKMWLSLWRLDLVCQSYSCLVLGILPWPTLDNEIMLFIIFQTLLLLIMYWSVNSYQLEFAYIGNIIIIEFPCHTVDIMLSSQYSLFIPNRGKKNC